MNNFKKIICMLALFILACIINPLKSTAQTDPPPGGCDPLDPACPIDGGISLLIAAGIGIGAKKAYSMKKKEQK